MKNQLELLEEERKDLVYELRALPMAKDGRGESILQRIREIDSEISKLKSSALLDCVNAQQRKKREIAALVWDAEQPTEDITTSDGKLHKTKAKKYPKLSSIPYAYFKFAGNQLAEINTNGNTFYLGKTIYEYGRADIFTRFESFDEFLTYNSILPEDISQSAFDEFTAKLQAANDKLAEAIKGYDAQKTALNVYMMQHIGLVSQSNLHLYKYEIN